jgi:hypothetical protein
VGGGKGISDDQRWKLEQLEGTGVSSLQAKINKDMKTM